MIFEEVDDFVILIEGGRVSFGSFKRVSGFSRSEDGREGRVQVCRSSVLARERSPFGEESKLCSLWHYIIQSPTSPRHDYLPIYTCSALPSTPTNPTSPENLHVYEHNYLNQLLVLAQEVVQVSTLANPAMHE